MKINPEIMSFAMAHPILTTIFGLGALAAHAQGLPISLIPEQLWGTAMRDDMVSHG